MQKHVLSGGRYPVLRAIALLYLIGAGVAVAAGLIACLWILLRAPVASWGDRGMMCLSALAATFFLCIGSLAIAEVLKLVMDIEQNTRLAVTGAAAGTGAAIATQPGPAVAVVAPTATAGTGVSEAVTAGPALDVGRRNRMSAHLLDEETAEGALLRGH